MFWVVEFPCRSAQLMQQVTLDFRELKHAQSTWGMMQIALSLGWQNLCGCWRWKPGKTWEKTQDLAMIWSVCWWRTTMKYHYSHSVDMFVRGKVIMIKYGMNDGELFEVAELSYGWWLLLSHRFFFSRETEGQFQAKHWPMSSPNSIDAVKTTTWADMSPWTSWNHVFSL